MNPLIKDVLKHSKFNSLVKDITKKGNKISITGLNDPAKAHMIYALMNYSLKKPFIICQNEFEAKKIMQDLSFYNNTLEVIYIPARDVIYYDIQAKSREINNERSYAISKLISKQDCIFVTTIDSAISPMLPKENYKGITVQLKKTDKIHMDELLEKVDKLGYTRTELVEGKGQITIRGGIIDIFPMSDENPYRIEFFGDEIDNIRKFDVLTQQSIEKVEKIEITFSNEFMLNSQQIADGIMKLKNILNELKDDELKLQIKKDILALEEKKEPIFIDRYFNLLIPKSESIIDYLDDSYAVYLNESTKCKEKTKLLKLENDETLKQMIEKKEVYPKYPFKYLSFEEIEAKFKYISSVYIERINQDRVMHAKRKEYNFSCREVNFFRSSMDILIKDIKEYTKKKKTIVLVLSNKEKIINTIGFLKKENILVKEINKKNTNVFLAPGIVYCIQGIVSSGFEIEEFNLVVISENITHIKAKKEGKTKDFLKDMINSYEDLNVGDYIVHINHGIGQYLGLETIDTMGIIRDYMKLMYKDGGMLYIPITSLDSIKKYVAEEGYKPKLNKLGSKEWENTKQKVKQHVEIIAKDLVKLYAIRTSIKGHAFSKDTLWQKEFEADFEHEITKDQQICIKELKESMEQPIPMDRLLCGDVGYGKTEVAIRGAFKAVMDLKQVAYLVPTTVLSMQQYNVFKNRMEKYDIKVEMLSRFKTRSEQIKIIQKIRTGEIDVVIGTHRLLSSDVLFKDLGFLIIDEEHRFGVKHKEKIKKYKNNIDVLSMTATPIPRTLHMSILGIREISVILTPPKERLPVHTYVLEYNEEVIQKAIEKELERNGQVLYINNRVENIEKVVAKIMKMIPNANIGYAHGQMSSSTIEKTMMEYTNNKMDILVCTTILESGIDIPNANTIIVENADKLGLAQLYQIRGRVGRSNRAAYAYITYNKHNILTLESEKRLSAIKEYTEFGSGLKIALRDLEIRGAGNILGEQQHGHMILVGYDMYVNMLQNAVAKEKNNINKTEEIKVEDVKINVDISANIPNEYIKDSVLKIEMYQKLSNSETDDMIQQIKEEMVDRFGSIPKETNNLIEIVKIRNTCRLLNINEIKTQGEFLIFASKNVENHIKFRLTKENKGDILTTIKSMLKKIQNTISI